MTRHVLPFADYRPIAWAEARDDATNPTCVILHLTASEATSQHGYFSNPANKACSNTHVARNGHIEQYIRGDRLSAADSYGSSRAFSIETQGADANGQWTPEQCESIARILAWAHRTYGIPLRLMTSSATGERGIGWHRLGIDGNFPSMPNILAGRIQRGGGESWSSHFGKVCPGDNRIKQIPAILTRAIAIAGGADTPGGFMTDLTEEQQHKLSRQVDEMRKIVGETATRTTQLIEKVARLEGAEAERREATLKHQRATAGRERLMLEGMKTLAGSAGVDPGMVERVLTEALADVTLKITKES